MQGRKPSAGGAGGRGGRTAPSLPSSQVPCLFPCFAVHQQCGCVGTAEGAPSQPCARGAQSLSDSAAAARRPLCRRPPSTERARSRPGACDAFLAVACQPWFACGPEDGFPGPSLHRDGAEHPTLRGATGASLPSQSFVYSPSALATLSIFKSVTPLSRFKYS